MAKIIAELEGKKQPDFVEACIEYYALNHDYQAIVKKVDQTEKN